MRQTSESVLSPTTMVEAYYHDVHSSFIKNSAGDSALNIMALLAHIPLLMMLASSIIASSSITKKASVMLLEFGLVMMPLLLLMTYFADVAIQSLLVLSLSVARSRDFGACDSADEALASQLVLAAALGRAQARVQHQFRVVLPQPLQLSRAGATAAGAAARAWWRPRLHKLEALKAAIRLLRVVRARRLLLFVEQLERSARHLGPDGARMGHEGSKQDGARARHGNGPVRKGAGRPRKPRPCSRACANNASARTRTRTHNKSKDPVPSHAHGEVLGGTYLQPLGV